MEPLGFFGPNPKPRTVLPSFPDECPVAACAHTPTKGGFPTLGILVGVPICKGLCYFGVYVGFLYHKVEVWCLVYKPGWQVAAAVVDSSGQKNPNVHTVKPPCLAIDGDPYEIASESLHVPYGIDVCATAPGSFQTRLTCNNFEAKACPRMRLRWTRSGQRPSASGC